jgi:hypothetical protein
VVKAMMGPLVDDDLAVDDAALREKLGAFCRLRKTIGGLKKAQEECRAYIEHAMGSHATLLLPDGSGVRRKLVRRKGHTVQPSEYFNFTPFGVQDDGDSDEA